MARILLQSSSPSLNFFESTSLAYPEYPPLISTKKIPELDILIARLAGQGAFEPPDQHCQTPKNIRPFIQPPNRTRSHEYEAGTHKVLPKPVPHAPNIDTLLT